MSEYAILDYVNGQVQFNLMVESLTVLTGQSREEVLEAYKCFPGDWHEFYTAITRANFGNWQESLSRLKIELSEVRGR